MSPLLLANSGLYVKARALVATLADSGLQVRDAERVTLIYDSQSTFGRDATPKKDSFFEAYVREVLRECADPSICHYRA